MEARPRRPVQFKAVLTIICTLTFMFFVMNGTVPGMERSQGGQFNPPEPDGAVPQGSVIDGPLRAGEEHYGVPDNKSILWWNRDKDLPGNNISSISWDVNTSKYNFSAPPSQLNKSEATDLLRETAAVEDTAFNEIPDTATWNKYNFRTYASVLKGHNNQLISEANIPNESRLTTSHYPVPDSQLATGRHGNLLKDIHGTIFQLPGSVESFQGTGTNTTWIPPTGEVQAMLDFRTREPIDYDPKMGERARYELLSVSGENCLHQQPGKDCSGTNIAKKSITPQGHMEALNYHISSLSPSGTLVYAANVTARYRIHYENQRNDGSWYLVGTSTYLDYAVVQDTINYRYWNRSDIVMGWRAAQWPNGTLGLKFNFSMEQGQDQLPPAAWANIQIGNSRIDSEWGYVTWRDTKWDEMKIARNGRDKSYNPIATPISTHIVPLTHPQTNESRVAPVKILNNESRQNTNLSVPENKMPSNVNPYSNIGGATGQFNATDSLRVLYRNRSRRITTSGYVNPNPNNISPYTDVSWDPLIPGASTTKACIDNPCVRRIGKTRLSGEYLNTSNGKVHISARVEGKTSTGQWVPISGPNNVAAPQIWRNTGTGWELAATSLDSRGKVQFTVPASEAHQNIKLRFDQNVSWFSYTGSKPLWDTSRTTVYPPYNPQLKSFFLFWIEALAIPLGILAVIYSWLRRDVVLKHI